MITLSQKGILSSCYRVSRFNITLLVGSLFVIPLIPFSHAESAIPPLNQSLAHSPSSPIIKGKNDSNDYRFMTLPNGLKILLVQNPRAQFSSVSMNVNVGSSDEPEDLPGLAHFLEHMLFMGTARYPSASDFGTYISDHGGAHNASTTSHHTSYFFDISTEFLPGALDRFAQMFTHPLFATDYIERERHSVDSEFRMYLDDGERGYADALQQAFNPQHPESRFKDGNLSTLGGDTNMLQGRLKAFFEQYYAANAMQLVITSSHSFDQMTRWVSEYFSDIPARHHTREIMPDILTHQQLPASLEIESPLGNEYLVFNFQIPDPNNHQYQSPYGYIKNLITRESPQSLINMLKEKDWISQVDMGISARDGLHALTNINFTLTSKGAHHLDDIQASLFGYLNLIKQHSHEKWRYDEVARLNEQAFNTRHPSMDTSRAKELSINLGQLPESEVITAEYWTPPFSATEINSFIERLTPDNLLRVHVLPEIKGDKHASPFYKTPYRLNKIIGQWPKGQALPQLQLPSPNPFIPDEISLLNIKDDVQPHRIINTTGMDAWLQSNSSLNTPRVEWRIRLMNPASSVSLRQQMMETLLAGWLYDSLLPTLHAISLANHSAIFDTKDGSFNISVSEWRSSKSKTIEILLDQLVQGSISRAQFDRVYQKYNDQLTALNDNTLNNDLEHKLVDYLLFPLRNSNQLHDILETISLDDLRKFKIQWLKKLHVQLLAVGNTAPHEVIDISKYIEKRLKPNVPLSDIPTPKVLNLNSDTVTLRPKLGYRDSAILIYRQSVQNDSKTQAVWELIGRLLEQPFFLSMRTEQQLGYTATTQYMTLKSVPGLYLMVQSSQYSGEELKTRITSFLQEMTPHIESLTDEQLNSHKKVMKDAWLEKTTSLYDLAEIQSTLLRMNNTRFDLAYQQANAIENIHSEDLKSAWKELLNSPNFVIIFDADQRDNEEEIQHQLEQMNYLQPLNHQMVVHSENSGNERKEEERATV